MECGKFVAYRTCCFSDVRLRGGIYFTVPMTRLRGTAVTAVEGCFRLYGHLTYFQTLCISTVLVVYVCVVHYSSLHCSTLRFTALHTDTNPRTPYCYAIARFQIMHTKACNACNAEFNYTIVLYIYSLCCQWSSTTFIMSFVFKTVGCLFL